MEKSQHIEMPASNPQMTDLPYLAGAVSAYDEDESRQRALDHCNMLFASRQAESRVEWALEHLPKQHVLTSSFGAQAAVSLHMVTQRAPGIPVIFIDTGYLFPETYEFVDTLNEKLNLNLQVFRSNTSPAWQEARYGERWLQGVKGLATYNRDNKVEPMQRALRKLNVGSWFAGLRREQSESRANLPFLDWSGERWKIHPIADWSDREVHLYLKKHKLPYHPLWHKGYVSIGDVQTTRSLHDVDNPDQTRFFGLKRECGLHEIDLSTI
jgi:phosphoadenosine phosphosulfate reductase